MKEAEQKLLFISLNRSEDLLGMLLHLFDFCGQNLNILDKTIKLTSKHYQKKNIVGKIDVDINSCQLTNIIDIANTTLTT